MSVILLSGCRSPLSTVSAVNEKRTATVSATDSTYLHDSIRVEYRPGAWLLSGDECTTAMPAVRSPDTVYMERWHTRWRERTVVRTDTVMIDNVRTETVRVRYVPRFYKICTALTALGLLILLLRVMLYLRKR